MQGSYIQHCRWKKNAPSAIRKLVTKILATFPEDFIKKEFKSASTKVEIVTDEIASEFSKYQMESIPKCCYKVETTEKSTSNRVQSSYWKHAYGIAETYKAETDSESRYVSIDKYWSKVRMLNGTL